MKVKDITTKCSTEELIQIVDNTNTVMFHGRVKQFSDPRNGFHLEKEVIAIRTTTMTFYKGNGVYEPEAVLIITVTR